MPDASPLDPHRDVGSGSCVAFQHRLICLLKRLLGISASGSNSGGKVMIAPLPLLMCVGARALIHRFLVGVTHVNSTFQLGRLTSIGSRVHCVVARMIHARF